MTATSGNTDVATLRLRTLVLLGALTAAAPLVTDFYLPALPDLARSLGTTEAAAQLTVSVSIVGLALGQLVAGPLSDRVGRLAPLRVGCCCSPSRRSSARSPTTWAPSSRSGSDRASRVRRARRRTGRGP